MRYLNLSFDTPEENLAFDEALLECVEAGQSPSTLRLWECPVRFVVLGSAQTLVQEVEELYCAIDGVPVMRRCTAGGCVLQGPGSLNFSLALRYDDFPEIRDLHASYGHLLQIISGALKPIGVNASHEGVCDLAVGGRKVSGNAQRRKKHACLHHGTLLYRADRPAMARYLKEPKDRPDYRGGRDHEAFVGELALAPDRLREALCAAFAAGAASTASREEMDLTRRLVQDKYRLMAWIRRR